MKLISVIVTAYKNPKNLERALRSVVNQTYRNIEILVIDGGNLKENEDVVKKFDDERIVYYGVEKDRGVQHARNLGMRIAKGEYLAYLDEDDEWDPTKLEKQVKEFDDPNVALVICWSKIKVEKGWFVDKTLRYPEYEDLLRSFNLSSTSAYLIRKDVLREVGGWDELIRGMHEYDIALKLAKKRYKISSVPEPLMIRHRVFEEQLGTPYWKIAEQLQFWSRYGRDFIPYLGVKSFVFNCVKMLGLVSVYLMGYIFHNRIWRVIYPIKTFLEGTNADKGEY